MGGVGVLAAVQMVQKCSWYLFFTTTSITFSISCWWLWPHSQTVMKTIQTGLQTWKLLVRPLRMLQ